MHWKPKPVCQVIARYQYDAATYMVFHLKPAHLHGKIKQAVQF
jgi:hypothetical protein